MGAWVEPGMGAWVEPGVWESGLRREVGAGQARVCNDPPEYAGLLYHHLGCFSVVSQLKQSLGTLPQNLMGECHQ